MLIMLYFLNFTGNIAVKSDSPTYVLDLISIPINLNNVSEHL